MHTIGDKVKCFDYEGLYEIIASKDHPIKSLKGVIPPIGFDYALKRVDGFMSNNFESYEYILESMIKKG